MEFFEGRAAGAGIAVGKIAVLNKEKYKIAPVKIKDARVQLERVASAKAAAKKQLQILHDKAVKAVGSNDAALFKAHRDTCDEEV